MSEIVFTLMDGFSVVVGLLLLAAAVVTAVRCGQKKLSPAAGWILAVGFAISLLCDFGYFVSNLALNRLLGPSISAVLLFFSVLGLLGQIVIAAGIAMFSAKRAAPQEVGHG